MKRVLCLPLLLLLMAGCSDDRVSTISAVTTAPCAWPPESEGTMTNGIRVDTVGKDTVITMTRKGKSRLFAIQGMTGFRGTLARDSAELVIGEDRVSVRPERLSVHGPKGSLSVNLSKGPLEGRDLIVKEIDGKLVAVPFEENRP